MNNQHFARFHNDVNNTASSIIAQMTCMEKGLDWNQVKQMAQQDHLNSILQQEQMRQMNQVISRHYNGGGGFISKLKEVFTGGGDNFFPQMGMPGMPMSPIQAFMPQVSGPTSPQHAAGMLSALKPQAINTPSADTQQLQKDVDDLKQMVTGLVQALQTPQPQQAQQAPANLQPYTQGPVY